MTMEKFFTFNLKVWSFGITVDFEYPYIGVGLGPFMFRIGYKRPGLPFPRKAQ